MVLDVSRCKEGLLKAPSWWNVCVCVVSMTWQKEGLSTFACTVAHANEIRKYS